jgi:4-hydroxybenzoate polyprenyltransferase
MPPASGAAQQEPYLPPHFAATNAAAPYTVVRTSTAGAAARASAIGAVAWAVMASTLHRIRRGEGALLAINLSLIVYAGADVVSGAVQALVSVLAMLAMYAFNDLYDAPQDWKNPKKDRALIATWIEHRRVGSIAIVLLKLATVALALTLGPLVAAAAAAVMIVNVIYSAVLKGVPVGDIVAVWLWGALYAAVVTASMPVIVLVGVMTGICHLFQALDDRAPDAANGITTTAVRSSALSRNVLIVLSTLLFVTLHAALGVLALTAFTPLALFFLIASPGTGWLLTKAYFAVIWLYYLGITGAAV